MCKQMYKRTVYLYKENARSKKNPYSLRCKDMHYNNIQQAKNVFFYLQIAFTDKCQEKHIKKVKNENPILHFDITVNQLSYPDRIF